MLALAPCRGRGAGEPSRRRRCRIAPSSASAARSPSLPHTGKRHSFYRIDSADWVNVVPVTPAGEIVMVRQYRHGLRDVTLEIPGGMVDPGETPEQAAARELLEETGYRAERLEALGSVNPNPALFGNRVLHLRGARLRARRRGARTRAPRRRWSSWCAPIALRRLLREGRIDHALVMAALLCFDLAREADRRMAARRSCDAPADAARRLPGRLPAARRRHPHLRPARRPGARALPPLRARARARDRDLLARALGRLRRRRLRAQHAQARRASA